MISRTPEQLMLYNARLKFQLDAEARLLYAREEGEARGEARGRQEGRQEGEEIGKEIGKARGLKLGRITLLQELLGLRLSTVEEFTGYDESQLTDMADQLQQQLRTRGETT